MMTCENRTSEDRRAGEPLNKKIKPVCEECGSEKVVMDAFVQWNIQKQDWEVQVTFDKDATCHECGEARNLVWLPVEGG